MVHDQKVKKKVFGDEDDISIARQTHFVIDAEHHCNCFIVGAITYSYCLIRTFLWLKKNTTMGGLGEGVIDH